MAAAAASFSETSGEARDTAKGFGHKSTETVEGSSGN
jgi:hypothetical protein